MIHQTPPGRTGYPYSSVSPGGREGTMLSHAVFTKKLSVSSSWLEGRVVYTCGTHVEYMCKCPNIHRNAFPVHLRFQCELLLARREGCLHMCTTHVHAQTCIHRNANIRLHFWFHLRFHFLFHIWFHPLLQQSLIESPSLVPRPHPPGE